MYTKLWFENLQGRDHLEEVGIDGDNIKMDFGKTGWEGGDWIHLAQDRNQLQALVNTVMHSVFHKRKRISQQGLCSMVLAHLHQYFLNAD
jgi:hypothetical protein